MRTGGVCSTEPTLTKALVEPETLLASVAVHILKLSGDNMDERRSASSSWLTPTG